MFAPLKSALRPFRLPRILPSAEDAERAYLEGSMSILDLEYRERQIAKGLFRNNRRFGW